MKKKPVRTYRTTTTTTTTKVRKKKKTFLDHFQTLLNIIMIGGVGLAAYVAFFMPAGTAKGPTDAGNSQQVANSTSSNFNLYSYINEKTSASGKLVFDCAFTFDNGDKLKVQSSQDFKSRLGNSQIVGSTIYTLNGNSLVLDDSTYIQDGVRHVKRSGEYVKAENIKLDGGNLNIGKIEDALTRDDKLVSEDGVSCYKYTGTLSYGSMSNDLRNYIRNINVNVSDIDNLNLDISLFVTENGLPYKMVIEFQDAQCMIKAKALDVKNCKATGSFAISFVGFNNVESISFPQELTSSKDGSYVFSDKVDKYLNQIGY